MAGIIPANGQTVVTYRFRPRREGSFPLARVDLREARAVAEACDDEALRAEIARQIEALQGQ